MDKQSLIALITVLLMTIFLMMFFFSVDLIINFYSGKDWVTNADNECNKVGFETGKYLDSSHLVCGDFTESYDVNKWGKIEE